MPEKNNQCSSDVLSTLNISVSKRTLGTDVFQSSNDCPQYLSHIQQIYLTSGTVQSVVSIDLHLTQLITTNRSNAVMPYKQILDYI